MMLNSITRYKRLLLALLCGSMSYSTLAKVYSWRDADGAMHYSQFPRQIVEKNAAQSRSSRKEANMDEVVKDLSSSKASNLLDGLDDIVANANAERQAEKVLTRRDPQLLLIEQQLARQQAAQRALLLAKQVEQEKKNALIAANELMTAKATKSRPAKNNFMAGIHKRAYGNEVRIEEIVETRIEGKIGVSTESTQVAAVPTNVVVATDTVSSPKVRNNSNQFLAGIQHKLKRNYNHNQKPVLAPKLAPKLEPNRQQLSQIQATKQVPERAPLTPAPNYILDPIAPLDTSSMMLAVDSSLEDNRLVENSFIESKAVSKPTISHDSTRDVRNKKPKNAFLAGIQNKLNRQSNEHKADKEVLVANQLNSGFEANLRAKPASKPTAEEVQNKFLAEINKKLFRAHLATDSRGTNIAPESELVKSNTVINAQKPSSTTVKSKELIQGADQIKAIESEISSNQPSKVQAPSAKQVNSALMLSRLSYNHNARLPLSGAGTNQLDRQGIDVSSQFVHDVNNSAE